MNYSKIIFYLVVFCLVNAVLPVVSAPDGARNVRNERRALSVPSIEDVPLPSVDEKKEMSVALTSLVKAELKQDFYNTPSSGAYSGLLATLRLDKLPKDFAQSLKIVVEGLDKMDRDNAAHWDSMDSATLEACRNWVLLEACCRRDLGFSLELESTKARGRLRNFMWKSSDQEKGKEYLEAWSMIRTDPDQSKKWKEKCFELAFQQLPPLGYQGTASADVTETIMKWYGQVFLALVPEIGNNQLPLPVIEELNGIDTNITGRELSPLALPADLPEDLKNIVRKECVAYQAKLNKNEPFPHDLYKIAYERNKYLINLLGLSLDEYCGILWDSLDTLSVSGTDDRSEWKARTRQPNAREREEIDIRKNSMLTEWRRKGIPAPQYLGVKALFVLAPSH